MMNNKNTDQKIEDALSSIEGIKRAVPQPYLLTRINARLNQPVKTFWENATVFITRPVILIAGLCLLLTANLFVLVLNTSSLLNPAAERFVNTTADEEEDTASFAANDNFENQ
jgi:hypothetical protein